MAIIKPGSRRGSIKLVSEKTEVYLDPSERVVYFFFLSHPEGVTSDEFINRRHEIFNLYAEETRLHDYFAVDGTVDSLCSKSKVSFYRVISCIRKKFIKAVGPEKAKKYIVKYDLNHVYRTDAAAYTDVNLFSSAFN